MTESMPQEDLDRMHTPEAIAERINASSEQSYMGDFVLGAVDGTVTTFAIVAGATGAGLSATIAVVLGLANIAADAFSMAASNFLKTRSDHQSLDRFRRIEESHIERVPDAEREEIRQIFEGKGFEGELLEEIVKVITSDRKRWVDTMLTEEWGLRLENPSAMRAAVTTFVAFALAGMVPLLPLLLSDLIGSADVFLVSVFLTGLSFIGIGWLQGKVTDQSPMRNALETLLIGSVAAALAYIVGAMLHV